MQLILRTLAKLGFGQPERTEYVPDYEALMRGALERVRNAELCIQEARTLEELDTARANMAAAWAEVQQLVRTAKRERGIALKPISETEAIHRTMREFMSHHTSDGAPRRKTGTNR